MKIQSFSSSFVKKIKYKQITTARKQIYEQQYTGMVLHGYS